MRLPPILLLVAIVAAAVAAVLPVPWRGPGAAAAGDVQVRLVDAFPGLTFDRPVFAAQPPDGTARMFVAEQDGRIWSVEHPAPAPPATAAKRLFLDLSASVSRFGNEEGLLGFAFHPDYSTNRRLFVHYSAKYAASRPQDRRNELAEFVASAADPDVADPASERTLLVVPQPYENHNGGWIGFDAGALLLVSLGDGGSAGDPGNRAQDLGSLLGKILRIDVDAAGGSYGIPPGNPFVARAGAQQEIWAYGLRNAWRCSIDRVTGDLWAGDVGQDAWEEIDRVVAGGNYGWRRREGFHAYRDDAGTPPDPLIDPVADYPHSLGRSVTGGYVYRGTEIEALAGSYVYADFETGRVWALADPYGAATTSVILDTDENVASFAEDRTGELFVLSFGGRVLALRDGAPPAGGELPATLSELNLFRDLRRLRPAAGALAYDVITPLWADGASKRRFVFAADGSPMSWTDADAFGIPDGAFAVKTFARRGDRLETRVIRRVGTGWVAAAYRWREDGRDADRVDERTVATVGGGEWTFPSPDDCRRCHTTSAGFLLGLSARQIGATNVARWTRRGAMTGAPAGAALRTVERNLPVGGAGRTDARVRSYLDANCSFCHRPDDPTNASLDLRAATPLAETGALDALPQHGDVGVTDARILAAGIPERSTLLERMRVLGDGRMPQIGTVVPDRVATRRIERWIRGLGGK